VRRREVTISACTLLLAAACAWVPLDPGAEAVAVRSLDEVATCERLGKTSTRTLDHIGPVGRRESKIEEELAHLARNEAVRMGGNVVAPLEPTVVDGERRFGIYRCP
jgi:hypothetical protein